MPRAIWNGVVIAESDNCVIVEGDYYFPREDTEKSYLVESDHRSLCPWKGHANYYHIEIDGERNENGAFYYPNPTDAGQLIKDRIAFWNGVTIELD